MHEEWEDITRQLQSVHEGAEAKLERIQAALDQMNVAKMKAQHLLDTHADKDDTSAGPDEVYDESGNKITVKKAMTDAKDIKKAIKEIEKKISANKKTPTLTDEESWEIADKLAELKAALEAQKA